ncbi:hypothetical protein, unlikely [Trypanosoma congolense IL3000]|uniref:Uncharacterized protein n=1 Tax=Trypanosoma congolense (strain IL3000) TaxID=1068625 RepID=F9WBU0_TRYCI|nr:hypothetical protein, unlikely [Trypanosoma congolense IL3000]
MTARTTQRICPSELHSHVEQPPTGAPYCVSHALSLYLNHPNYTHMAMQCHGEFLVSDESRSVNMPCLTIPFHLLQVIILSGLYTLNIARENLSLLLVIGVYCRSSLSML